MSENNKVIRFGNIVFDYITISILLNISFITVIPFIPVLVGLVAYFNSNASERSLLIIFKTIKENIKIIYKLSLVYIVVFGAIILNLFIIEHDVYSIEVVIKGLSYVGLFALLNIVINAPIILLGMNVTLRELLVNCIFLVFGDVKNYAILIVTIVAFIYGITYSFLLLVFGIYFVVMLIAKLTHINFKKLKERIK